MARKKRAEKAVARLELPVIEPTRVSVGTKTVYHCSCPVCGRRIPEKRAIKAGNFHVIDHIGYFQSIDWDPDKPFGSAWEPSGYGSVGNNARTITPDEVPELFRSLKGRMLQSIVEFRTKGWMTEEEIQSALRGGQTNGHVDKD